MADQSFDRISAHVARQLADDHRLLNHLPPPRTKQRRAYPIATPFRGLRIGRATEDIDQGASGGVQFWSGSTPETISPTNEDEIEAYARMGDVTFDNWVYVFRFPSGWEIIMTEC